MGVTRRYHVHHIRLHRGQHLGVAGENPRLWVELPRFLAGSLRRRDNGDEPSLRIQVDRLRVHLSPSAKTDESKSDECI
jgi:hypothetical protein